MKPFASACVTLAISTLVFGQAASAGLTNRYVVMNNAGALPPYDALTNAAPDIQTAINYAYTAAGSTVLVAAATYNIGGTKAPGRSLTNRVYISKAITVRSIDNDPATTIIKGAFHPGTTNGWSAVRCVYMIDGASLVGFTLTNGATITTNEVVAGSIISDASGGGVYANSALATISNCVITGNSSFGDHWNGYSGGGAFRGTFFNCTFTGNRALYGGGGAQDSVLSNCTVSGNWSDTSGGGVSGSSEARAKLYHCVISNNAALSTGGGLNGYSIAFPVMAYDCTIVNNSTIRGAGASQAWLYNCTIMSNTATTAGAIDGRAGGAGDSRLFNCLVVSNFATSAGGGTYGGTLTNCTLAYNVANGGGGANFSTLYNCLLYGNKATDAGGAYASNLKNCTVVGNYASHFGGGVANWGPNANIINSVIYSNQDGGNARANWAADSGGSLTFSNSCTIPTNGNGWAVSSMNNITNDPRLISYGTGYGTNLVPGNYRLSSGSPCINTGLTEAWMAGTVDLDGNNRVDPGNLLVDMGCYEHVFPGGTLILVR